MRHEAFPLQMCIVASGRLSLHPSLDRMQMRHLFKTPICLISISVTIDRNDPEGKFKINHCACDEMIEDFNSFLMYLNAV